MDGESAPAAAPAAEPTGTQGTPSQCAAAAPECTFAHDTALEHDGCFDASPAACMIFRLRRREVFSPLACRVCAQRRAAAAAARRLPSRLLERYEGKRQDTMARKILQDGGEKECIQGVRVRQRREVRAGAERQMIAHVR